MRDRLTQYASERNWHIVQEFVEAGASARTAARPVLHQLLARCRDPRDPIDVVVVHKIDSRPSCARRAGQRRSPRGSRPRRPVESCAAAGGCESSRGRRRSGRVDSPSSILRISRKRRRRGCDRRCCRAAGHTNHRGGIRSFETAIDRGWRCIRSTDLSSQDCSSCTSAAGTRYRGSPRIWSAAGFDHVGEECSVTRMCTES